jgi:hypothetical protein
VRDVGIECFGGPLDGMIVNYDRGGPAFPHPYGWYYARYSRENTVLGYYWKPEGFIATDITKAPFLGATP